jgi:predicted RNA-binding protein YlxR (DUF448 family)
MLAIAQDQELDRGATSVAPGTERTCAVTRETKPVSELIRFVVGPDGSAVPDVKRKLPGRGLWVSGTRAAIAEAVKRRVFARSFKREVRVPADLAEQVERLLEQSALDALAIAGKAGRVATGFAKVEAALSHGEAVALIHATDASAEGRRKLGNTGADGRKLPVIEEFSGERLDLALNRPNVVHAALLAGPGSETFLARAARLVRYRTNNLPAEQRGAVPLRAAHKDEST